MARAPSPAKDQELRMYGLSRDANFSFLIGKEICQVAIGPYDVQFNWENGGLSVWGKFIYKLPGGDRLGRGRTAIGRESSSVTANDDCLAVFE